MGLEARKNDHISRSSILEKLDSFHPDYTFNIASFRNLIKAEPSAEKKGKWIIKETRTFAFACITGYEPVYECSECGMETESYLRLDEPIMPEDADFPMFCQHCGAKMEESDG